MESEETAEKKLEAKKKTSLYFRPRVRAQLHAHRRFTFPLSRLLSGLFLPPCEEEEVVDESKAPAS